MSRKSITSAEAEPHAVIERRSFVDASKLNALRAGVATIAVSAVMTMVGIGHEQSPDGHMSIEAAPEVLPPLPETSETPHQPRHKDINEHLAERLEIQNQVAELVNYRLECGEGQDVFWGTVSIYDTKANQELANITNPIVVTPRNMGWNMGDDLTPYVVVGVVPGKPTAAAPSPWQKITLDAFVVDDRDVLATFTDHAGNSATYPQLDVQTLDVPDSYIRGVAPTARYDLAGDIFSLQLADGSAVGQMNPVMPRQKAAA